MKDKAHKMSVVTLLFCVAVVLLFFLSCPDRPFGRHFVVLRVRTKKRKKESVERRSHWLAHRQLIIASQSTDSHFFLFVETGPAYSCHFMVTEGQSCPQQNKEMKELIRVNAFSFLGRFVILRLTGQRNEIECVPRHRFRDWSHKKMNGQGIFLAPNSLTKKK